MPLKVLYEDNHLIAVFKPAGILTQADITGEACLMDEVKIYLKKKYKKTGNVFLGLLHRLDRPVSGIVLFAKTSKGASRLSEQIRNHEFKKEYQALVEGKVETKSGTLTNYLFFDENAKKTQVFDSKRDGAQIAELSFQAIARRGSNTLIKIDLKTGRHHQIRAQFAHLGHPVVGDKKYGAKTPYRAGEIALSAVAISFKAATGGERKQIKISPSF